MLGRAVVVVVIVIGSVKGFRAACPPKLQRRRETRRREGMAGEGNDFDFDNDFDGGGAASSFGLRRVRMGRAYSPCGDDGVGSWGVAPGWDGARRWRLGIRGRVVALRRGGGKLWAICCRR